MKILVLNCGSSSVKYKLIDTDGEVVLAEGGVEKVGIDGTFIKFKLEDGTKQVRELGKTDHKGSIEAILNVLTDPEVGCIESYSEIEAVGHRVVHGGEKFSKSILITPEVEQMVKECYDLAPLHNPANITGIDAMKALLPGVPQVGVFDTAFHQTMPARSFLYPLPYKYYTEDHVRRYGFHGTSHRYVSQRVCEILGVDIRDRKIITCHVGNGGSITAVDGGKSVDTSMGLTPTEGLMMGTRVGDVDPGAITFLMKKHNLSADDVQKIINKESGMLGIAGTSDNRTIESRSKEGDEKAQLVENMLCHQLAKYIGGFAAAMGGVDAVVFTGGIGENNPHYRTRIAEKLAFLGVGIDEEKNSIRGEEVEISKAGSNVKLFVIPTNEELMIAQDTYGLVK